MRKFALLSLIPAAIWAQTTKKIELVPLRIRVAVEVSGDEALGSYLSSKIKYQLRRFADVTIVDEDSMVGIKVAVAKSQAGVVAAATLFENHVDYQNLREFLGEGLSEQQNDLLRNYLKIPIFVRNLAVDTIHESQIEKLADDIVTQCDTELLEPRRQSFQKALDALRKTEDR